MECKICIWNKECVNVGEFKDGDCHHYRKQRKRKGIKELENTNLKGK